MAYCDRCHQTFTPSPTNPVVSMSVLGPGFYHDVCAQAEVRELAEASTVRVTHTETLAAKVESVAAHIQIGAEESLFTQLLAEDAPESSKSLYDLLTEETEDYDNGQER